MNSCHFGVGKVFVFPLEAFATVERLTGATIEAGDAQLLSDMQPLTSLTARVRAFTSGSEAPVAGDAISGATSGATAVVVGFVLTSGSWVGADAAGLLFVQDYASGPFQSENIDNDTSGTTNVLTIGGDFAAAGIFGEIGSGLYALGLTSDELECGEGHIEIEDDDDQWKPTAIQFVTKPPPAFNGAVASATATTTTLDRTAPAVEHLLKHMALYCYHGTGKHQARLIKEYTSGGVCSHTAWTTTLDTTSRVFVYPASEVPWNADWDAEVESEAGDALVAIKLDHLLAVAETDDVEDNTVIAKIAALTGDWSDFTALFGEASLEGIYNKVNEQEVSLEALIRGFFAGHAPAWLATSGTTTTAVTGDADSTLDDAYVPGFIYWYTGNNLGMIRVINSFDQATGEFSFDALPNAVQAGDTFQVVTIPVLTAAVVNAQADQALTDYDGPTNTELAAALAPLALETTVAGLLDETIGDSTVTVRQLLRIIAAVLGGKASGLDTNAPKYRNVGDTKDVVDAVTDDFGNRTAVTLDLS